MCITRRTIYSSYSDCGYVVTTYRMLYFWFLLICNKTLFKLSKIRLSLCGLWNLKRRDIKTVDRNIRHAPVECFVAFTFAVEWTLFICHTFHTISEWIVCWSFFSYNKKLFCNNFIFLINRLVSSCSAIIVF